MALKGVFAWKSLLQAEVLKIIRATSFPVFKFSTLHSSSSGRPKQPVNAFIIFMQEQRRAIQPDDAREFMRAAGTRWRELTETEKQPYVDKQKELQAIYREELKSYNALLSKEEKLAYLKEFRENKKKKIKRSLKKEVRGTDPPKRNATAFAFYVSSRFSAIKVNSIQDGGELMKDITTSWKSLFSHQKQPFVDQAFQDKQRYHEEMQEYIQRMKNEDKVHLLPVKYQKQIAAEERKMAKKGSK